MLSNKKIIEIISIFQLLAASIICIIFSSQEYIELPDIGFDFIDKILHFSAFFIYGISIQTAIITNIDYIKEKINISPNTIIIIVILFGMLFAASDEIHQYFVPGRSADILDWIADSLGIICSIFLYNSIQKIILKIKNKFNA